MKINEVVVSDNISEGVFDKISDLYGNFQLGAANVKRGFDDIKVTAQANKYAPQMYKRWVDYSAAHGNAADTTTFKSWAKEYFKGNADVMALVPRVVNPSARSQVISFLQAALTKYIPQKATADRDKPTWVPNATFPESGKLRYKLVTYIRNNVNDWVTDETPSRAITNTDTITKLEQLRAAAMTAPTPSMLPIT